LTLGTLNASGANYTLPLTANTLAVNTTVHLVITKATYAFNDLTVEIKGVPTADLTGSSDTVGPAGGTPQTLTVSNSGTKTITNATGLISSQVGTGGEVITTITLTKASTQTFAVTDAAFSSVPNYGYDGLTLVTGGTTGDTTGTITFKTNFANGSSFDGAILEFKLTVSEANKSPIAYEVTIEIAGYI
jgi:hypothetical protein